MLLIIGCKTITSKSFEYKTKLVGRTLDDNNILDVELVALLKYLINFWRPFDFRLINCEIELDLSWSKECIISGIAITPKIPGDEDADPPAQEVPAIQTTAATFEVNNAKFYVPVLTLPINDNTTFLENVKQGFKRAISWKKYRSEITAHTKNNNLDHLIDPVFRNINRFVVLSFKNGNSDPTRDSIDKYYLPLV